MILLALATAALAQDTAPTGFDAHGFHLAALDGDVRDPLAIPRAGTFRQGEFGLGVVYEYAQAPLMLVESDANGEVLTATPAIDHLSTLNLGGAVAIFDRLRLDVTLPLYVSSTGLGDADNGLLYGDLRATAALGVVRPDDAHGLGLAVFPYLDVPTGSPDAWLGTGEIAGGVTAGFTYEVGVSTWTVDAGYEVHPSVDAFNVTGADAIPVGVAVGWSPTAALGVTAEYQRSFALEQNPFAGSTSPSEVTISARGRTRSGAHAVAGVAVGVGKGAGTAAWRVFVGGGFGRIVPATVGPVDPDGDGLVGEADACPDAAETPNGWEDDDGCPEEPATLRVRTLSADGPLAGVDVRAVAGEDAREWRSGDAPTDLTVFPRQAWAFAATRGCWQGEARATGIEGRSEVNLVLAPRFDATVEVTVLDEGGHPLPDAELRWEDDGSGCVPAGTRGPGMLAVGVGNHRLIATAPGKSTVFVPLELQAGRNAPVAARVSPSRVRVQLRRIDILEKVYFALDSAEIDPASYALLDEVATTILARPELGRVEIGGHTDSTGTDEYNRDLSQRRVDSVRAWLVDHGVDPARLSAVGYGELRPVDTNVTESGRSRNRRVEFTLLDAPG